MEYCILFRVMVISQMTAESLDIACAMFSYSLLHSHTTLNIHNGKILIKNLCAETMMKLKAKNKSEQKTNGGDIIIIIIIQQLQ